MTKKMPEKTDNSIIFFSFLSHGSFFTIALWFSEKKNLGGSKCKMYKWIYLYMLDAILFCRGNFYFQLKSPEKNWGAFVSSSLHVKSFETRLQKPKNNVHGNWCRYQKQVGDVVKWSNRQRCSYDIFSYILFAL